ncbi:sugar phosphate isomerase/epimerase family protein [Georgenia faecalis]|uniref:Sugar phosphate isomerase/epimerase family protein n=1 Tax=Georgenia faecalis TaxID=2483799 RepID=A0ABV9D6K8_9MICO|nr:sugar phosphate isomerase/epimerase [Georgenia faecalis]
MSGTSVALSTSSCYPEGVASAFEQAARLGYDGVEVMVWREPATQDVDALRDLVQTHQVPVLSVHAPTLLLTQRVWGRQPWGKVDRSVEMAQALGAPVIVVHPPFRWQTRYARGFVDGVAARQRETDVKISIENMFPWKARAQDDGRAVKERAAYLPHWNPVPLDYANVTLDLSHAGISGLDALAAARALGPRLAHVHLTDSTGSNRDEHLVPGRGTQPCAELLAELGPLGFTGSVAVEVTTRRLTPQEREEALAGSLTFARQHLGARTP